MIKQIFQLIFEEKGIKDIIKKIQELKKYHSNLEDAIKTQKIYYKNENQNIKLNELINKFSKDDFKLIHKFFVNDVKEFLSNKELKKYLKFQDRSNSNQIGINTIYVEKPVRGLWTTGKATFFLPTKTNVENQLTIELQSVVPVDVIIGIEKKKLHTEKFSKLQTKKINIKISKEVAKDKISEIFIYTNKLWLPNTILDMEKSVVIGIRIISIGISD